jgi:tetratricopeptide (TPR) repeat protein
VFWNGLMSLQEGEKMLLENAKDDFSKIIRVYNYGDKQTAKQLYPKMDRVIEKASIAIQKHSMVFNRKEYVKWVKRSYLIMGEAHFYKQDYLKARRVFDYVYKQYPDDPVKYEALLWLAKTYIQLERYGKADAALNLLLSKYEEPDFPSKVKKELPYVQADLYLAQGKYNEAYPYLTRALEINYKRHLTNRVLFILGQINQLNGDFERATEYYRKLIKRNPPYEMAFRARLNMAECFDATEGNIKSIVKLLNKMLKESKNKDFRDQIYYALADVELKVGHDSLAVEYLKKSVASSVKNDLQKAMSALKVADMLFEEKKYEVSQNYFDTAVNVLPKDYPNYDYLKSKALVLGELVQQHKVLHEQDSLQTLAHMSEEELNAVIDQAIARYRYQEELRKKREEEEKEAREIEERNQQMESAMPGRPGSGPGGPPSIGRGNGKWYFYNPQVLSKGTSEFVKKWGKRKLEDNWRISDKRQMIAAENYDNEEDVDEESKEKGKKKSLIKKLTPYDREFYIRPIPKTKEEFRISDSLMVEAYNKLGFIYKERLRDTVNAIENYESFLKRFPQNKYELEAWFALYQLYSGKGEQKRANHFKGLILSKYPESDYAKIINDPDYFVKLEAKKGQIQKLYERTYNAFEKEQYFRVLNYANRAVKTYSEDTTVMPRFLYLRAMALGKVATADSMYVELKKLVKKFPNDSIVPQANEIMKYLRKEYGFDGGEQEADKDQKQEYKYVKNDRLPHFVVLVVNTKNVRVNPLKVRLSDFDKKYFRLKKLRIRSLMFDKVNSLITVGNFENKRAADNYYEALKNDQYVLSGIAPEDIHIFPISTKNYPIMYKDKDLKGYLKFLKEVYGVEY